MTEENKDIEVSDPGCPVCGSKKKLIAGTIAQLKIDGKLSKDAFPKGAVLQVPLIDQAKVMKIMTPTFKVNTLVIFYDICADCLTFYSTGAQLLEQDAQMQVTQGPPPGQRGPDMKGGSSTPF